MTPQPSRNSPVPGPKPQLIPFRPASLGCARPQCPNVIPQPQRPSGRQAEYCSDDCRAKARHEYQNTENAFVYLARVIDSYHRAATGVTPLTLTATDNQRLQAHLRDLRAALAGLNQIRDSLPVPLRRKINPALTAATALEAILNTEHATRAGTAYAAALSAKAGHRKRI